jgi:dihydroorotate dehydrogenase
MRENTRECLISPPFGNLIRLEHFTNVLGSFTWEPRPGLIWNTIKTLRPVKGGFRNKIGLRNKGITSIELTDKDIISIVGLEDGDWERIVEYVIDKKNNDDWPPGKLRVEINLGCPNVHEYGIKPDVLKYITNTSCFDIIVKIPATDNYREVCCMAVEAGVRKLHLSNTIPTPRGGISGRQLFDINYGRVAWANENENFCDNSVIIYAGGGIYTEAELENYWRLGVNNFSISSVLFHPLKAFKLIKAFNAG